MTSVASARAWLRTAAKRGAYAGVWRSRWQQPDRVMGALRVRAGQRVADLGAGTGYFTFRLARAVGPHGMVYAVDSDHDARSHLAARAAREGYGNVVVIEPQPHDPALPEPVGLAMAVNLFHHLEDQRAYFAALADALTADSRLAIIEPEPRWFLFGHATDPARIRSVLADSGYVEAAAHDFLAHQSFLEFAPR